MIIGIKQFSNNLEQYKKDLIQSWKENLYDYIELYVHPAQMDKLQSWIDLKREYGIKFTIHAPHFSQGMNLADKSYFEYNKMVYEQVDVFAKALNAEYTVVHGGMDGSVEEIVRQLKLIKPYKMRIENKPYVAPRNPDTMVCRGAIVEEIKYIMENYGCEFNFDIGHAFCSAVSQKIDQFEYMKEFLALKPESYHLSDGVFNDRIDIHYHFGEGDYDWKKIIPELDLTKNMTLETITKKEKGGLEKVIEDIKFLKNL